MTEQEVNKIMSEDFVEMGDQNGISYWDHKEHTVVAVIKPEHGEIIFCRCIPILLSEAIDFGVKFKFGTDVELMNLIISIAEQ